LAATLVGLVGENSIYRMVASRRRIDVTSCSGIDMLPCGRHYDVIHNTGSTQNIATPLVENRGAMAMGNMHKNLHSFVSPQKVIAKKNRIKTALNKT